MTVKAYKSPLGFHYTEEEQQMYYRALAEALKFFETYGKGDAPTYKPEVVRDRKAYDYCRYYENPVGSLQEMEAQLVRIEDVAGEWFTQHQLALELGMSRAMICKIIKDNSLEFREVMNVTRKIRVYRISDMRQAITARQPKNLPQLTEEEYRSGRWMRGYQLAETFGIGPYNNKLSALLISVKAPYKMYAEVNQYVKFYDVEQVRSLPQVIDLINRLSK